MVHETLQSHRQVEQFDAFIADLPSTVAQGDAATVAWMGKFLRLSGLASRDDIDSVIKTLQSAGYEKDAYANNRGVKDNPKLYAHWIVGQALNYFLPGDNTTKASDIQAGAVLDDSDAAIERPAQIAACVEEYTEKFGKSVPVVGEQAKQWTQSLGKRTGLERN